MTRTRRRLLPLILLALVGLILLVAVLLGGGGDCGGAGGSLSPEARSDIPPQMARVYLAMAKRWNIDVAFLASIGAQETDHGRNPAANKVNSSGCVGVMQVGVGGACGDFWARNKCDGNADGKTDVLNAADNVCAAARGLRKDKGAPPNGGSEEGYHRAACAYYGACADGAANYATEVMARAERYGFRGGSATDTHQFASNVGAVGTSCAATLPITGNGPVVIDPGANRPGTELAPELVGFLRRMAELLPRPLIVTTGTNHSPTTTSGNVSDHWDGHAADLGSVRNGFPATGGGYGDKIAEAAFLAAGEPPGSARDKAATGGLYTIERDGLRIQIIYKTYEGGDHFNHVHVGVRASSPPAIPSDEGFGRLMKGELGLNQRAWVLGTLDARVAARMRGWMIGSVLGWVRAGLNDSEANV